MTQLVVATITFGHKAEDVERALRPALDLVESGLEVKVVCIDDSSGCSPLEIRGVDYTTTARRSGYAGAVNELISRYRQYSRLILINPDAAVPERTLLALANSPAPIAVPTIVNELKMLENVRYVTTAKEQFFALLLREPRSVSRRAVQAASHVLRLEMPPACPSGAVLAIDTNLLLETPLNEKLFWLEMSDWVRRRSESSTSTNYDLTVIPEGATHVGASTSIRYPLSVAASQMVAKTAYVREYGDAILKKLLPIAVMARSLRFALISHSPSDGYFLVKVGLCGNDWRVNR